MGRIEKGRIVEVVRGYKQQFPMQQNVEELSNLIEYLLRNKEEYQCSLEIGVCSGATIACVRKLVKIHKTVTIDPGIHKDHGLWYILMKELKDVIDIKGFSTNPKLVEYIGEWGLVGKFDYIFIDGNHLYLTVLNDTNLAWHMAEPDCVVVLHDSSGKAYPGVKRRINQMKNSKNFRFIKEWNINDGLAIFKVNK